MKKYAKKKNYFKLWHLYLLWLVGICLLVFIEFFDGYMVVIICAVRRFCTHTVWPPTHEKYWQRYCTGGPPWVLVNDFEIVLANRNLVQICHHSYILCFPVPTFGSQTNHYDTHLASQFQKWNKLRYLAICLRYEIKNSMTKPMINTPMHAIPNLRGVFKIHEGNQSMIQVLAVLCVSNPCISISMPPLQKTSFSSSDILKSSSLIHSLNRTGFTYYLWSI